MREISGENVTLSPDAVDTDLLISSPSAPKTESMKVSTILFFFRI